MTETEWELWKIKAKDWITDSGITSLGITTQHNNIKKLFAEDFWKKIITKHTIELYMSSPTEPIKVKDEFVTWETVSRLADQVYEKADTGRNELVRFAHFYRNLVIPMYSGKVKISTYDDLRKVSRELSEGFSGLEDFHNNKDRLISSHLLVCASPEMQEKVLRKMRQIKEEDKPKNGLFNAKGELRQPVWAVWVKVFEDVEEEERIKSMVRALARPAE